MLILISMRWLNLTHFRSPLPFSVIQMPFSISTVTSLNAMSCFLRLSFPSNCCKSHTPHLTFLSSHHVTPALDSWKHPMEPLTKADHQLWAWKSPFPLSFICYYSLSSGAPRKLSQALPKVFSHARAFANSSTTFPSPFFPTTFLLLSAGRP